MSSIRDDPNETGVTTPFQHWDASRDNTLADLNSIEVERATVGKQAPVFKCQAFREGEEVDIALSDYLGYNVVIYFYKTNFANKTPQELNYIMDRHEVLEKLKTKIAFCSPDKIFNHGIFAGKLRQQYGNECLKDIAILSDPTREIGQRFGLAQPNDTSPNP